MRHALIEIAADHPAFAGHFPGMPILPGALLLDEALAVVAAERGLDLLAWEVGSAKFLEPVRPGARLEVVHSGAADRVRFDVRVLDRLALSGSLVKIATDAADDA